jgi:hypothetical protein
MGRDPNYPRHTASGLAAALHDLSLSGTLSRSGRWLEVSGERGSVFVVASGRGHYFTWCDIADARAVERFGDPVQAIQRGLERAQRSVTWPRPPTGHDDRR